MAQALVTFVTLCFIGLWIKGVDSYPQSDDAEGNDFWSQQHNTVKKHIRTGAQPGYPEATFMHLFRNHHELEQAAQAYIGECKNATQPLKQRKTRSFSSYNQNIYVGWEYELSRAFAVWWGYWVFYDYQKNRCLDKERCDIFKNIIGGKSKYVGCAHRTCRFHEGYYYSDQTIIVCNYANSLKENERPYVEKKDPGRIAREKKEKAFVAQYKEVLLSEHNRIRDSVKAGTWHQQPRAKQMGHLTWNDDLQATAQMNANRCELKHGPPPERRTIQWSWVGQNIYEGPNITGSVVAWADEAKFYNFYTQACSWMCGHYTALAWAKTTEVGCGIATCEVTKYWTKYYVICNYGVGGNFNNEKPYEVG